MRFWLERGHHLCQCEIMQNGMSKECKYHDGESGRTAYLGCTFFQGCLIFHLNFTKRIATCNACCWKDHLDLRKEIHSTVSIVKVRSAPQNPVMIIHINKKM